MLLKYRPKSSECKCSCVQIDILCGSVATDMGKPQTCGIITSSLSAIIAVVLKYKHKYKYKYKYKYCFTPTLLCYIPLSLDIEIDDNLVGQLGYQKQLCCLTLVQ